MSKFEDESMEKLGAELWDYISKAIRVKETYMNVNVILCENSMLYIEDVETGEQLAAFKVVK